MVKTPIGPPSNRPITNNDVGGPEKVQDQSSSVQFKAANNPSPIAKLVIGKIQRARINNDTDVGSIDSKLSFSLPTNPSLVSTKLVQRLVEARTL